MSYGAPFLVWLGGSGVSGVVYRLVWYLYGCIALFMGVLVVV